MSHIPVTDRDTLRLFWQAGLRQKRLLWLSGLHSVGAVLISAVTPFFIGKMLASLSNSAGDPMHYLPYAAGAAGLGLVLNRIGFVSLLAYQAHAQSYLQSQALDVLLRRSVGFHNNNIGGKLVSDAIDYPNAFSTLTNALFINLLPFLVILGVGSIIVFFESWLLGLVVTLMAVYAVGSGVYESRKRAPMRKRRLKATKAVTGHLADTILNVQTVKTFAREGIELRHNDTLNNSLLQQRLQDWSSAARAGNRRMAILTALQLAMIVVIIHMVQRDPALLGVGIFAFSFTIMLATRLFEVNSLLRNIEESLLQALPLTEILQEAPEISDRPNAKPLHVKKGAIDFSDVDFYYQDSANDQPVFSRLSLHIRPGEKVGLVGPSGGGKSTLTRLLLRFEDINGGVIAIDGQDISSVTQASLRQHVSYVPQEPLLFHRSIRENIAYGKPGASDQEIERAARSAHAHSFIQTLPQGYDTIVGERGVKLSGGQRQRIAIARAILKDAPILVLDEATSALDSESEAAIQQALRELMEKRTAIVIAHRLSTIQRMDRIIVLDGGNIVEEGTHAELRKKKNGLYAKLWKHQSGGFIEE